MVSHSAVSQSVADRGGFGLLESFGYKPVNRYLPPRKPAPAPEPLETSDATDAPRTTLEKLFAWADKALTR